MLQTHVILYSVLLKLERYIHNSDNPNRIISPLPVSTEGTLGLHSVPPSVRPSVVQSVSHTSVFRIFFSKKLQVPIFFCMWVYRFMLQIKFECRSI